MRMIEWRALELTDMAEWPRIAQGGALVAGLLLMQLLGYQFYLSPKLTTLHQLRQQESELSEYLERTALQVAQLPAQQRQLRQAQQAFDAQLRALPAEQELASLLAAVNQAGVQHQLTISRIDWGARQRQGDLYRLPLNLEWKGEYHDIGRFVAAIAALPRLIHFDELRWQRVTQDSEQLQVRARAVTYQYQPEGKPND